jgi:hypothetical protein
MTRRGRDWMVFAEDVLDHIEKYTIPQYGDKGDDQLTTWTPEDCKKQVEKYLNRHGKNSRTDQDELDILKAAHYLQVMMLKMREKKSCE